MAARHGQVGRAGIAALVVLLSASDGAQADVPVGHSGPVRAIAVLPDGRVATGGFDAAILIWDIWTGRPTAVRRGHVGAVDALVAVADGCLVSGSEEGRIASWCGDAAGRFIEAHAGRISALARSADGRMLVSASFDRTVKTWALTAAGVASAPRLATTHTAPVASVAVRRDGSVVSGSHDGEVRLTQSDGRMTARVLPAAVTVLATAGERIVVGLGDGRLQLLGNDLVARAESELIDGPPTAIAVTADATTAVVSSARTPVTIVDLTGRTPARPLSGSGGPVWALTLTRDETQVITAGSDGSLRAWALDGGVPRGVTITTSVPAVVEATADDGARVFRACAACHTTKAGDPPKSGPTLAGIMGRRSGSAPGYAYSRALTSRDIVWTPETIARLFEVGPATFTPGTTMPEQRITDPEDRRALVAWLAHVTK